MHRSKTTFINASAVCALISTSLLGLIAISAHATQQSNTECNNIAVVTGFWPPTNEMLRQWSQDSQQNPSGWQGANWRGLGYDVHAFFPEFPPDADPTNDQIGDPGSVGAVGADFQVDYQDASADFWRIMDTFKPRVLITTSRGGDIGWELEAVEGGHNVWISDRYGDIHLPTAASIDPRSKAAIDYYANGRRTDSKLPLTRLLRELIELNPRVDVAIDTQTSGNYLSGFVGLHGLYYNEITHTNLAAGHIHVGRGVSATDAREMIQATLKSVLELHPPCADDAG